MPGRVVIEITNDALVDPAETVSLTLGTPTNATLGAGTQRTVTIPDDDSRTSRYLPLFIKCWASRARVSMKKNEVAQRP